MQKLSLVVTIFFLLVVSLFAQDQKKITKMERFISQVGTIIRFEDYEVSKIRNYPHDFGAKVRVVESMGEKAYFCILQTETHTTAIAESDLNSVIEAVNRFIAQASVENNKSNGADYIENKFCTDDGFQVGYFVNKKKEITWFVVLKEYYSDSSVHFDNNYELNLAFSKARNKIDELKAQSK